MTTQFNAASRNKIREVLHQELQYSFAKMRLCTVTSLFCYFCFYFLRNTDTIASTTVVYCRLTTIR